MRILHVYGGNLYGGVERLLVALAQFESLAPEMKPVFALAYRGRLSRELSEAGASIHWLGPVRVSRPWQVAAARRRLRSWAGGERFAAAVCHSWWPYAIFGPALRQAGVPVALWAHDAARGQTWLRRWAGRTRPDLLLTYSGHIAASLGGMFPRMAVSEVSAPVAMPAGVTAASTSALRASLSTRADQVVILQVSRMEPWKGHALTLEALARLQAEPGWTAWIAGGAQRPQERRYLDGLRAQAAALGIADRIRWLGEREDVAALLAAADIFCQPNTGPEPFGIVFLEALAAGLPVVTTRGGGALDILTPSCGFLTDATAEGVAGALGALLADPGLRARLAAEGRARARTLADPQSHLRRVEAALATIARSEAM